MCLPLPQVDDVGRAMDLGREAAAFISSTFPPPVKLEFEKVRAWGNSWHTVPRGSIACMLALKRLRSVHLEACMASASSLWPCHTCKL